MTSSGPSTPQPSGALTPEVAKNIGWYFIEKYYELYNKNVDFLPKLYSANALLLHQSFPGELDRLHLSQGIEAIKARFAELSLSKQNRIVVTSADILVCLEDKILIVVTGEWLKDRLRFYAFLQTFLLSSGGRENNMELVNDVLRFPEVQKYLQTDEAKAQSNGSKEEVKETKINEDTKKEVKTDVKKEVKNEVNNEVKNEVKNEAKNEVKNEPKTEVVKKEEQEKAHKEGKPAAEQKVEVEPKQASRKPDDKEKKVEKAVDVVDEVVQESSKGETTFGSAPQKLSWAANLATTSKKTKDESAPGVNSEAPAQAIVQPTHQPQLQTQAQSQAQSKFPKGEWFPIYIRGIIEPINEDGLRKHLNANFGTIKFLKINGYIALCDFVDFESQQRAISAKETVLDGITISLEPRELKNGLKANKGGALKDKKVAEKKPRDKKPAQKKK